MKKFYLFLFAAIIFAACNQTSKTTPVNVEVEKAAVNTTMENMYSAFKAQNLDSLLSFYSEDMIGLGTDPSELWNKQQFGEMWKQEAADTLPILKFFGERFIKVSEDGHSAVAVDQYYMPMYSDKIPFRNSYHLIKINGNWVINFIDTGFIPKNEDISKLNAALD